METREYSFSLFEGMKVHRCEYLNNMPQFGTFLFLAQACKSWVGYGMQEGEIVIQVNPRQW